MSTVRVIAVSQSGMLPANSSPKNPVAAKSTALPLRACSKIMRQGLDVWCVQHAVDSPRRKRSGIGPRHDGDGVATFGVMPKVPQWIGGGLTASGRPTLAEGEQPEHGHKMVRSGTHSRIRCMDDQTQGIGLLREVPEERGDERHALFKECLVIVRCQG